MVQQFQATYNVSHDLPPHDLLAGRKQLETVSTAALGHGETCPLVPSESPIPKCETVMVHISGQNHSIPHSTFHTSP